MIIDITASVHIKFFVFSFILLPTVLTNANHPITKKIIGFLISFTDMPTLAANIDELTLSKTLWFHWHS